MQLFKNIYISILALVIPFVGGIQEEPYGIAMIAYGVLGILVLIFSPSKPKTDPELLKKLNEKLDEVDDKLDEGKGILAIANEFQETDNIPQAITIKYILSTFLSSAKEEVIPYTHALNRKAPNDIGGMDILNKLVKDVKGREFNPEKDFKELNEFENVLFTAESVVFKAEENGNSRTGLGILIITTQEVIMVPMKLKLLANLLKGKAIEAFIELAADVPFLGIGASSADLLYTFYNNQKPKELYYSEERKKEFEEKYKSDKGWFIPLDKIDSYIFPTKGKGLKGVDASITINSKKGIYKVWQVENADEFRLDLMDQLYAAGLLYENIFYPILDKYKMNWTKCDLVPHTEIDYEDPKMKKFTEEQQKY